MSCSVRQSNFSKISLNVVGRRFATPVRPRLRPVTSLDQAESRKRPITSVPSQGACSVEVGNPGLAPKG